MSGFLCKFRTVKDLGYLNLIRVLIYRLRMRIGLKKAKTCKECIPSGPFFTPCEISVDSNLPKNPHWLETGLLFSYLSIPIENSPPDWSMNPMTKKRFSNWKSPWWEIPDFDSEVGDIKVIWEFSRFDWLLAFSQHARTGNDKAVEKMNNWLKDWCENNPPFRGPNWKCGQEASIRVMHLAMSALILEQYLNPSENLRALVLLHLQRIEPTTSYAIAQCNNHATSEAAALFIGGILIGGKKGEKLSGLGRKLLETQVKRLVGEDGSFSQYSLNYHRVLLDTLSMVEVWRQRTDQRPFSQRYLLSAVSATEWLRNMVNPIEGSGPNLGANDGARLLPITNSVYRDYRPSVQLASALFANERAYEESGSWDDGLKWLKIPLPKKLSKKAGNYLAADGGFAVLRRGSAMAMLRYPSFKFRPSHSDALHLDLWLGELNFLRDGGSFSYNTDSRWLNYFSGTESHNTIQFDGSDQMPRLSRFLFGDWLRVSKVDELTENEGVVNFSAGYVCRRGVSHHRKISLSSGALLVEDDIKGFKSQAQLRWRLPCANWNLISDDGGANVSTESYPGFSISVTGTSPWQSCTLKDGWESLHYLEKTVLPILEISTKSESKLITEVRWLP